MLKNANSLGPSANCNLFASAGSLVLVLMAFRLIRMVAAGGWVAVAGLKVRPQ